MSMRAPDRSAKEAYEAAAAVVSRAFSIPKRRIDQRDGVLNWQHGRQVVLARRTALYLAVVAADKPGRAVARAAKLTQPAVRKALAAIEQLRDDPQFDARLSLLEQELMA